MNNLFTYLIELNICLTLFGLIYIVFFRKETDFQFRRFYIISAVVIALAAPLFKFGGIYYTQNSVVTELPYTILPEIVVGTSASAGSSHLIIEDTHWSTSNTIYWVVVLVLSQYFLFQLMQVFWFAFSNKKLITRKNGVLYIETNGTLPTFSFFNFLFFDNSLDLKTEERERIIQHELAHIKQKHSIDILLLEFTKISSWFNPIIWYLRSEIQDIHEYLADQKAITNNNPDDYSRLLAKMALNQANLSIGHHFNKSKTLKRIEMMKSLKVNVKRWKIAITIPLLIIMAVVVSCNDEAIADVMETSTQIEVPSNLMDKFNSLQKSYPEADLAYMETDGVNKDALGKFQDMDPTSVAHIEVYKERGMIGVIFNKNGAFKSVVEKFSEGSIHSVVDKPAIPAGGYEAFYQRISEKLIYPEQAKKLGVEGKVYVQMIINETGDLEDVTVVKGIGAGCDNAAIEAVKNSGGWSSPEQNGKMVKQRIILPITFSLGQNHDRGDAIDPAKTLKVDAQLNNGYYEGKVLSDTGKPLPGVNILVKGSTASTVSDINGAFKIKVKSSDEIEFSFIGKETLVCKMPQD